MCSSDLTLATGAGVLNELQGVQVQNTGGSDITIDRVTVQWENATMIEEIQIGGTIVWSGSAPSGTELDITDYVVTSAAGVTSVDHFRFDGTVSGSDFIITFTMTDGSTSHTLIDL